MEHQEPSGAKTSVLFLGPTGLFFHGGPYKAAGVYSERKRPALSLDLTRERASESASEDEPNSPRSFPTSTCTPSPPLHSSSTSDYGEEEGHKEWSAVTVATERVGIGIKFY